MSIKLNFYLYGIILFILKSSIYIPLSAQVKIYREPLVIPTYKTEAPEIMPNWDIKRYPYSMIDRLTNNKYDKVYNALYVENEYIKVMMLPEIGGRLHKATDKTNGYDFFYDQRVIKPGLVSLTGAWISGGIEWNLPIGHRPSCFRDTDWELEENEDGSKTVWTGEYEKLSGMRWSVGATVHPGRNWVETKIRLFNCTPYVQRFQYWATSAVRATNNYQAVIPTEIMTGHGKHEFHRWPIRDGVDVSYWKNIPPSSSFFAYNCESDFFGGYSPEENAGMVHFADHNIVRGKKLWTWGTAPIGRFWEKILTDGDLPYFEPQAGGFSDNQPSFLWIMPGETKVFSHFWFPTRDIGVFDYANLEGSINLDLIDDTVQFGWSPTGENHNAQVVISYSGKEIFKEKVDVSPANPFVGKVMLADQSDLYQLKMSVLSSSGDTLISFKHKKPTNPELPVPEDAPPAPADVKSQDELFTYGDFFYRFYEPENAKKYFEEALKRDPGDVRVNTSLGEMLIKDGYFSEALEHFEKSLSRDDSYFKAWYYKGLANLWLGNINEAEKSLNRSGYSNEWYSAAHFELAQLALLKNKSDLALDHIDRSIRSNADNIQALGLKAYILIKLEKFEGASNIIYNNTLTDPLDFFTQALLYFDLKNKSAGSDQFEESKQKLLQLTRSDSDNHLELVIRFARIGAFKEAVEILTLLTEQKDVRISPLVYYYKGYYQYRTGSELETKNDLEMAFQTDASYCFPFRLESFPVLEWAINQNPNDAQAHFLLGNLFRSKSRTDEALEQWEKSIKIKPGNAIALRNIGFEYAEKKDFEKARKAYQDAISADPTAGRAIVELGWLNTEMNVPYKEQIGMFEKNIQVVSTYNEALKQLIGLYVITGQNKKALQWLQDSYFKSWEKKYEIHSYWVQANIKQGDSEFKNKNFKKALEYYKLSLTYPENLEVAEQPNTINARKYYKIATALEKSGETEQAKEYYQKVVEEEIPENNANQYFKGKALEALDKFAEAKGLFENMLAASDKDSLKKALGEDPSLNQDGVLKSNQNAIKLYIRSLALDGLGNIKEAESMMNEALAIYPLIELNIF